MMSKDDVLERSFELDLPPYLLSNRCFYFIHRPKSDKKFMVFVNYAENWLALVPNKPPKPEFYKFAYEISLEKFQISKCWEIYVDEDSLQQYYDLIKNIDLLPKFVLHVTLFYVCPHPKSIGGLIKQYQWVFNFYVLKL